MNADVPRRAAIDPRMFQIGALGVLLAIGAYFRDFALRPEQSALAFAAALVTQRFVDRADPHKPSSAASAVITALSLSLLLRADNLWAHPAAATVAVTTKRIVRVGGKHLFNPANLGVIFSLIVIPGTWVSAAQWGDDFALAGWFVALGGLVVHRARRADVTLAFLAFHLGALAARVVWLGQRAAVLLHQAENGALLLFAFFMISDPMTIPNDRRGRVAHAALVAALAYAWQFRLYRPNALLWALFFAAPAVPLWDSIWPAPNHQWKALGGSHDENDRPLLFHPDRRLAVARRAS